jgi:F0F1-type ATP synthase alpha subunit
LKQPNGKPQPFEREVLVIYAGISGLIDRVKVEDMHLFETTLIKYFDHHAGEVFGAMQKERAISEITEARIKETFISFKIAHPELFIAPRT